MSCACWKCEDPDCTVNVEFRALERTVERLRAEVARLTETFGQEYDERTKEMLGHFDRAEAVTAVARGLVEALEECRRELSYYERDDCGHLLSSVTGVLDDTRAALARAREAGIP